MVKSIMKKGPGLVASGDVVECAEVFKGDTTGASSTDRLSSTHDLCI